MKKSMKIAAIVAAAAVGLTAIGLGVGFGVRGCSNDGGGNGNNGTPPTPTQIVTEKDEHKITDGLHKINVSQGANDFVKNKTTEYALVVPSTADERIDSAAALIINNVNKATGATLSVVSGDTVEWSNDKKYIVLNEPELFGSAGLSVADDIGETGYAIKTAGNSVFIYANSSFGAVNGALKFLNFTLGYEMFADDTVVYKAGDTVNMPIFDVVERPDFDWYIPSNSISKQGQEGMGFMDTGDVFIPVGNTLWHNSFKYIDPDKYGATHAEWFSTGDGGTQLCYTAHGDEKGTFDLMLDTAFDSLVTAIEAEPDLNNVTFTMEDTYTFCECSACQAEKEKYGTDSAVVVKFVNKLADKLDAYLTEQAQTNGTKKREITLLFFAYLRAFSPPVKTVDGAIVPIDDDVVCRDNVGVYIAPIDALYSKSFYHDDNSSTADIVSGWGALSKKLYMWLYETNYRQYLYPLNSYDSMIETLRFCKQNNATFMFVEGQYNQGNVTAFGKLKEYFNSKAFWNVNIDFKSVCDDFFDGYFGAAASPMRKYFDELQAHMTRLEKDYPEINGGIYNDINLAKYWPKRTLDGWMEHIDEAYAAIEDARGSMTPEMYETYKKHIKLESIFPRFALLTNYSSYYSSDALKQMRNDFRADCAELNITMHSENTTLADAVFAEWN